MLLFSIFYRILVELQAEFSCRFTPAGVILQEYIVCSGNSYYKCTYLIINLFLQLDFSPILRHIN